jgi:hypothetical protein
MGSRFKDFGVVNDGNFLRPCFLLELSPSARAQDQRLSNKRSLYGIVI